MRSATAIAAERLFVTSYLRLITVEDCNVSPITSASTRTSFSVPTTRRGSLMSTGLVDAQAAATSAMLTTTDERNFTGPSSWKEDNPSPRLQKSAARAGVARG